MSHNPSVDFLICSATPPKVELSDAGLYVRFLEGAEVVRTVIQSEWPHIAVDLDAHNNVIGIEAVPAPAQFSVGKIPEIAASARVGNLPKYRAEEVEIANFCAA